ncbi:MAG TPA: PqqD family protein [Bacteroidota bacterium]|nr:PqqD family protein [Bacteroidota bacterium]
MKKQTFDPSVNLLDVRPQRAREWVEGDQGEIIILIPKFTNPFLRRWLLPYLKSQNFRLKLDAYGSAFWNACDGSTTVSGIIESMKRTFPSESESMNERVIAFTRHLFREKFIRLETTSGASH